MKPNLKLLCIAPYPLEAPSVRYRVTQFLPHLRQAGIQADFRPFMDSRFYRRFYQPSYKLQKALRLVGFTLRRLSDAARATDYDAVFIHREAALFGPPLIETLIARYVKKPIVFDFDDAIHVPFISPTYGKLATWLKYPQKTPDIVRLSSAVVVGNRYLEDYATPLNANVNLVPTVVDAHKVKPLGCTHAPIAANKKQPVVLGWMGSHSTTPYLESLAPVLQEVARRHDITLRVVGARRSVAIPGVEVDNRQWSLKTETADLQSFDIGLYPIIEDQWSLGKSGFKAIEYMAVGIPAVCSPVGATCDIVQHGVHGFLPRNEAEWTEQLGTLIEDKSLRRNLGQAGRARVEDWYCLERQAPRLQMVLETATQHSS
ncbi:MAG: glycosyltransferase family 4 protein [Abitibacteriaceae bacterium]|nr:glycosyltransferase family 4 protein [Abditibacteriaceae bacterium]